MINNTLTNCNIYLLNGVINTDISDNSVIFNILNIDKAPTVNSEFSYIRNTNENKINLLNIELSNRENLFNISDPISLNYDTFILEVDTIINKFYPLTLKKKQIQKIILIHGLIHGHINPSSKLKNTIRKKNKLFNSKKKVNVQLHLLNIKK